MKTYYVCILKCSDNSFYTGITNDLERRLVEHKTKNSFSYTFKRLPVKLFWYLECLKPEDAIRIENQLKGWSKRKKKALITKNWKDLVKFSKNYTQYGYPERKMSSTGSD